MTQSHDVAEPFVTIEPLAMALARRETTAAELVDRSLGRIAGLDPALGAFARVFGPEARRAGEASDLGRLSRAVGPLEGLPLGVKDLFHYAGHPTEAGSRALAGSVSTGTAASVRRLEAAGMVVVGKTNTVEFAFGGWGTNRSLGTPRNPWDHRVHRVPGGSSSGSAVAVAAGLVPAALGTDTGGSVRIPAGLCGIVGLKSSKGLVSRAGILPLCPTHDTVGPLTRCVRDAALLMQVMAGPDPDDPVTLGAPALDYLSAIEGGVRGLRVAVLADADLVGTEPAVRVRYDAAVAALRRLGATVLPLALPRPLDAMMKLAGQLMSAESYRHLARYVDPEDSLVDAAVRERILRGRTISAADYMRLLDARQDARREMLHALDRADALVAPTCPIAAIPLDEVDEDRMLLSAYGRFVNLLDFAALSIPMGRVGPGLPTGLQIVVRQFDDPLALRIGRALERDAGYAVEAPPGFARTDEAA